MALTGTEDLYNLALDLIGEYYVEEGKTSEKQYLACARNYAQARDEALSAHPWNEAKKRIIIPQDSANPISGYDRRYTKPTDCLRVLTVDDSLGSDVSNGQAGIDAWEVEGDYILADSGQTPGSWSSGKSYIDGQFFSYSSTTYEVLVTHTSDTTGADAAAQIAVDVAAGNIESKGGDYRIIYVEYIWQLTDTDKFSPKLKQAIAMALAIKIITTLTNDTKGKVDLINEFEKLTMPKARSVDAMQGKPRPIFSSEWLRSRRSGSGGWFVT